MKHKLILALLAVASILPLTSIASDHNHDTHAVAQSAASEEPRLTEATVKKIDKKAGKITLSHGTLPNGMPGMVMAFNVNNKSWLNQVKVGDKVLFRTEDVKGVMTLVEFKPVSK